MKGTEPTVESFLCPAKTSGLLKDRHAMFLIAPEQMYFQHMAKVELVLTFCARFYP